MNSERYRVYLRRGEELCLLATTGTPQGLGIALTTLFEEGELEGWDQVGVLDRPDDAKTGAWIISPFTNLML